MLLGQHPHGSIPAKASAGGWHLCPGAEQKDAGPRSSWPHGDQEKKGTLLAFWEGLGFLCDAPELPGGLW